MSRHARISFFFLAALAACSPRAERGGPATAAGSQAGSEVVATIGDEKITLEEVDRHAAGALQRLRHDEYEARRRALDQIIVDRLIDREAKARGLTRDALLQAEVEAKAGAPTQQEIAELLEQNRSRLGGLTPQEAASQAEAALQRQRRDERNQAFLDGLRGQASPRITLAEPRATLAIPADAPALGAPGAAVTVVEYLDYGCPYCHKVQGIVDEMLKEYHGKLRFVHRDYPIGNPRSLPGARAARCAAEQDNFWPFHRNLMTEPGDMGPADIKRRARSLGLDADRLAACAGSGKYDQAIQASARSGDELGVSGTPTFFINGRRMVGVRSMDDFRRVIQEELGPRS